MLNAAEEDRLNMMYGLGSHVKLTHTRMDVLHRHCCCSTAVRGKATRCPSLTVLCFKRKNLAAQRKGYKPPPPKPPAPDIWEGMRLSTCSRHATL